MNEETGPEKREKKAVGGEMVIPIAALLFTLYYFSTKTMNPSVSANSAILFGM